MDHTYIEEHDIADRYVTGTLEPAEAERFEEHYLSCPVCLDRLELAEAMKRGFTRVAEQEAAERAAVSQLALVAWLSRLGRQRQLAFLATVVVLLFLPTGLSFYGLAARDRARAEARSAHQAEARLRSELAATRRDLEKLGSTQISAPDLPASPLIVDLDQLRGAAGEPGAQLAQPAPGDSVVFNWVIDRPYSPPYLAVLASSDGKELHRGTVNGPPQRDRATFQVKGDLLRPGAYTLRVSGQKRGSEQIFTFRVLPRT